MARKRKKKPDLMAAYRAAKDKAAFLKKHPKFASNNPGLAPKKASARKPVTSRSPATPKKAAAKRTVKKSAPRKPVASRPPAAPKKTAVKRAAAKRVATKKASAKKRKAPQQQQTDLKINFQQSPDKAKFLKNHPKFAKNNPELVDTVTGKNPTTPITPTIDRDNPTIPDVPLSNKAEKKLTKEQERSEIADQIATGDVLRGDRLGDIIAPDVTEGNFLDRIDRSGRSDDVNRVLDQVGQDRDRALTDSNEMSFALEELKRRVSQGFSPQEREALSFQGRSAINQSLQTGLRAARAYNTGRNLAGGITSAAFNPAITQAVQQRRGLENDIMLAELSEKARALSEFGGLVERRDQSRATNLLNLNAAEEGIISRDRAFTTDIDKFNAAQRAKEIAARTAKNATGLGILQDEKDIQRNDELLRRQIQASEDSLDQLLSIA